MFRAPDWILSLPSAASSPRSPALFLSFLFVSWFVVLIVPTRKQFLYVNEYLSSGTRASGRDMIGRVMGDLDLCGVP
jgi:hypothetical protein